MHSNIGLKIKSARKAHGLTQKELALRIGKGFSTVQKYENGQVEPPISVTIDIANALNMSPAELYDFDYPIPGEIDVDNSVETRLMAAFEQLNPEGQGKAVERVEELAEVPKYRNANSEIKK